MTNMVGILNKSGVYYAFTRDAIDKGPVWSTILAAPAECPECGDGNIAPAAFDGKTLYVAAGNIPLDGKKCIANVRAINAATGVTIWSQCLNDGPVLGAVTSANGVLIIGEGAHLLIMSSSDGHTLYNFTDSNKGAVFYGPASITSGIIYTGNADGTLYAFSS